MRFFVVLISGFYLIGARPASACDGTFGATGCAGGATAKGAIDNDHDSREHHRRSEEYEHEARRNPEPNGEPNHEMMEHSHHEERLARMERMQAREFAREALQALTSRGQQASQSASAPTMPDGSPIDVTALQKIAELPVTGDAGPTENKSDIPTFKTLGSTQQAAVQASDLNSNGVSAANPSSALKAASLPASSGGAGFSGSQLQMPGGHFSTGANGPGSQPTGKSSSDLKAIALTTDNADNPAVKASTAQALKSLAANRARVMQQMGMRAPASVEESGPIRAKNEDIFNVVHTHYSSLVESGTFYREGEALPPTPGPSSKPPSFSRGL